jgi:Holliday junction resolvase RusA-like endonuclease
MPRPKGHFGTGKKTGILKATAPYFHTSKPDATKLTRSTEDACKGILWPDDSAVSQQAITKAYEDGRGPGVLIEVETLEA